MLRDDLTICRSFRQVWCTPQRAKYIIAFVCLSAAVITLPEFFQFKVYETTTIHCNDDVIAASQAAAGSLVECINVTEYKINTTSFGSNPVYSVGYSYTNQALFTFIPLLLLLLFNALLVRQVP